MQRGGYWQELVAGMETRERGSSFQINSKLFLT